MQLVKLLSVFIIALFLTTAYAAKPPVTPPPVFDESHVGILVTHDQPQFIIQLKTNPATGYSWFLRDYDDRVLTPIHYQIEPAKNKVVGAPSVAVWTFTVKKSAFVVPQQSLLRFVYARPWEGDDQSKQVSFRVNTLSN